MSWKAINRKKASVLLGYNLPFVLWTGWAGLIAVTGYSPAWHCPIKAIFHFCPSCGLTRQYAGLLTGHPPSVYLLVILALFILNSTWSVCSVLRSPRVGAP